MTFKLWDGQSLVTFQFEKPLENLETSASLLYCIRRFSVHLGQ